MPQPMIVVAILKQFAFRVDGLKAVGTVRACRSTMLRIILVTTNEMERRRMRTLNLIVKQRGAFDTVQCGAHAVS